MSRKEEAHLHIYDLVYSTEQPCLVHSTFFFLISLIFFPQEISENILITTELSTESIFGVKYKRRSLTPPQYILLPTLPHTTDSPEVTSDVSLVFIFPDFKYVYFFFL